MRTARGAAAAPVRTLSVSVSSTAASRSASLRVCSLSCSVMLLRRLARPNDSPPSDCRSPTLCCCSCCEADDPSPVVSRTSATPPFDVAS